MYNSDVMDTPLHRKRSLNSSLKDARIFDDDAWEEVDGLQVKVKKELEPENGEEEGEIITSEPLSEDLYNGIVSSSSITPEMFDESPFNKELFKCMELNEDETEKKLSETKSVKRTIFTKCTLFERRSYKKTDDISTSSNIFKEPQISNPGGNLYERRPVKPIKRTRFTRDSPYKKFPDKEIEEMATTSQFQRQDSNEVQQKKSKRTNDNMESDPEVLARRQKQIDFGKNTIGYDNYSKTVARCERKLDDPHTPNKYKKYSRRGWDGLIKQWRLRLHKYDPTESEN